jgi:GNAT superfamily N-acetyltransferase
MRTTLRPARLEDFEYCATLYFSGMETIIRELNPDRTAQVTSFRQQWDVTQVRILTIDAEDIGWLQTSLRDGTLFFAQLFVESAFQRQGIGTEIMNHMEKSSERQNAEATTEGFDRFHNQDWQEKRQRAGRE